MNNAALGRSVFPTDRPTDPGICGCKLARFPTHMRSAGSCAVFLSFGFLDPRKFAFRTAAHTVTELASARQHQEKRKNWPTIMERAAEGI